MARQPQALAVSFDGNLIAAGLQDGKVCLWQMSEDLSKILPRAQRLHDEILAAGKRRTVEVAPALEAGR